MDKGYRIHTNIASDTMLSVNMRQDFDFLEVLSLTLGQEDAYRLHSSNYGVIVGRVLANDAFGIPNAKISIFIEKDADESSEVEAFYPYSEVTSKDKDGRRYNLLPDYSDDDCYRIVGTFPNKRLMLDDDTQLEIYDKYWKYTTVSNNSGDYMIFGVPTGSVTVHVDIDLSDIGVLSQKPRDFEYKGYNLTMFDSPSQFKESTNLDGLAQIFSQNKSIFVYPFWGDSDNGIAAITRADIQIQYKFEPTCVFMGSIVSDNEGHAIGHECAPDVENGMNNQLVGGNGTIEMIRRTTDGLIEEYPIKGNQLIDENGVWCYQIPMNLDYIGMDEYGNIVPTDNTNTGIPTRAQVRFRISKNETSDEGFSVHTAKYLVPMNPIFSENEIVPTIEEKGQEIEKMYNFGSKTPLNCFRDLYWNNVYSVKNYIPKVQVAHRLTSKNYGALKGSNLVDDQNQIPFNKLNIDVTFTYMIICLIYTIVVWIVRFINMLLCVVVSILDIIDYILDAIDSVFVFFFGGDGIFPDLSNMLPDCISLTAGNDEGDDVYYIGCFCDQYDEDYCPDYMEDGKCEKHSGGDGDMDELIDRVQRNLALEYKIVKLDFYQDWINGCLYMPLWYWMKRKKKSYLFGLIKRSAKNTYCSDSKIVESLRTFVNCNVKYTDTDLNTDDNTMPSEETKWHKNAKIAGTVYFNRGLIKPVENNDGLTAYYYAATQAIYSDSDKYRTNEMIDRDEPFAAIRLYATDIILLGNLNQNNMYGIPQFFTCLPSTTANIPPIATIKKENKDGEENGELTTGMDWNHDGGSQIPAYKTGLFMDLECTFARTRAKSCINVERLSELGVSLDMRHKVSYRDGDSIGDKGTIDTDGFITKYELNDLENRAMFATMNHIGFIPQEYQNLKGYYQTQIYDDNTNYLMPKFKFMYPTDFDGRLTDPISLYTRSFGQDTYDVKDESYITFRLGAENGKNLNDNSEGRIRHFYFTEPYSMPLYNNSYYFYFGIKKGSTAIDKFNEMFYSKCVKNDKKPFSLDIESRGRSYCPEAYDGVCVESLVPPIYTDNSNRNNAYAYIKVASDDINIPYSYTLRDSSNNVIVSEDEMNVNAFVIGGQINPSNEVILNCSGAVYTQKDKKLIESYKNGLGNGDYSLEIVDANGKSITEKITLDKQKIGGVYGKTDLSTKFINTEKTRIDYICNDNNQFYGEIRVSGITVDGYNCTITSITSATSENAEDVEDNAYKFLLTASSDSISNSVTAILYLGVISDNTSENEVKKCLCDKNNPIVGEQEAASTMNISGTTSPFECFMKFENNVITFYTYQPNRYILQLIQICPSGIINNKSYDIVNVENAIPFETYLNEMPTRFMIGTSNDSIDGRIAYRRSRFHSSGHVHTTTNIHMTGWYGTHQEDSYRFPKTIEKEKDVWEMFVSNIQDINSAASKRRIIKYKLEKMFSLSDGVYMTNASARKFTFTSTGGVKPILNRSVVPYYNGLSKKNLNLVYVLNDSNRVSMRAEYPNIVANNYEGHNGSMPKFNTVVRDYEMYGLTVKDFMPYFGNYFAAFTKDGGYINRTTIDDSIRIERSPSFTVVDPIRDNFGHKNKGEDVKEIMLAFVDETCERIENKSLPYLRAMSVDRRLDYDLVLFSPSRENNFSLYSGNTFMDTLWKGGRLSGTTFNGIEMSYDGDYNIISAITNFDSNDEISSATPTRRLEYSYSYSGGTVSDANIIYNSGYTDSVWESDSGKTEYPIIKRFYSAYVNDEDFRNMFWSNFNKNNLLTYANSITTNNIISGDTYVYKYPNGYADLYNGDFNRDDVRSGTSYPTKRFVDIANLPAKPSMNFNVSSCSYSTKPKITEIGTIECQAKRGEELNLNIKFVDTITMINPNADSANYSNVIYKKSSVTTNKITFTTDKISFDFKYNEFSCEGFKTYTRVPRIIQVLPYIDGFDGISYVKLSNSVGDAELVNCAARSLDIILSDARLIDVDFNGALPGNKWAAFIPRIDERVSYYMAPDGVWKDDAYFKGEDDERLESDNANFLDIKYHACFSGKNLKDYVKTLAFTVLTEREILSKKNDYLTKRIRLFETSEIFDTRDLELQIDLTNTYVIMTKLYQEEYDVMSGGQVTLPDEGDTGHGKTVQVEVTSTEQVYDTSKSFTQVLGFKMEFDSSKPIESRNNEAFSETGLMSYKFVFKNSRGEEFEVTPQVSFKTEGDDNEKLIVSFIVKWFANMNILNDAEWQGNTKCKLIAKTTSNFVYEINYFQLDNVSDIPKEEMTEGKNTHTYFEFKT